MKTKALTPVERRLVESVVDGLFVDLAPGLAEGPVTSEIAESWGADHDVRAEVITDILRGRHVPPGEPTPRGLRVRGARIVGRIDLTGIDTPIPLQLLQCHLPDGLAADNCGIPQLGLIGSLIGGAGMNAREGAVRLHHVRIGGPLVMSRSRIVNQGGPALIADGMDVRGDVIMNDGFVANGAGELGAIRVLGAQIHAQLILSAASLSNPSGPALSADGLQVSSDLVVADGFSATASSPNGAVRLLGAHIGGQLSVSNSVVRNDQGTAIGADGLIVEGDVFMDQGFVATGTGDAGAVRLAASRIGGQLSLRGASLTNSTGPGLSAETLSVGGDAFFDRLDISGSGGRVAVRLIGARIGGTLVVDPSVESPAQKWSVNGLTYDQYPSVGVTVWLKFLRHGTVSYRPQPYQQLAAAARAAGHDHEARRTLMAQRDDQRARGDLAPVGRAWAWFTKLTLGYGYQPWRALIGVVLTLAVAVALVFLIPDALGHKVDDIVDPAVLCTKVEKAQIAIDMAIPLISTSSASLCHITATQSGMWLSLAATILAFVGWALTALFAAGFTRIIRQP